MILSKLFLVSVTKKLDHLTKVWHSNSKYRKTIWQCNHKFDGGEKCGTPHLDEETIKSLFLKAANAIFGEKDGVREDYESSLRPYAGHFKRT